MASNLGVGVIGSGPSAIAAAKRLLSMGLRVTIIDFGRDLEKNLQEKVTQLSLLDPISWDQEIVRELTSNKTLKTSKIPKKMLFGSDYFYANEIFSEVINSSNLLASSSLAKGGFSVAWGGAMLPINRRDMDDWPIKREDLDDSFKFVLRDIPYSSSDDDLSSEFPNYSSGKGLLDIPLLAKHFLSKSRELYKNSSADELILAGQARLAVRARGSSDGCQYCGHCLSGCVYGSVYSTKQDLEKMVAEDKIDYLSGLHVIKVEEVNSVVEVLAEDTQRNSFVRLKFEKLFIGAGALNSTKILLESLGRYNERVRFKDSQKFLLPIISLKSFPIEWPNLNTFSSVYLESFIPKISERWVHMQVSPINDLFLQKIGIGASDTLKMHLAKPILKRILFGWCGLHSDYSSTFDAELIQPNSNNAFSRLVLCENANLQHTKKAHDFAKNLSYRYARQGIMVSPLPLMSKIGGGNHIGSSFPMSENSSSFFSTDTLGRHAKWNSVHIIDSSTLPSIPGTTIALLTMANADRIAKNAFSE